MAEERKVLNDLKLCFKCGEPGHRQNDSDAPCRGKSAVPSNQILSLSAAINALHAADEEDYDALVDNEGFEISREEQGSETEDETESLN